VTFVNCSVMKFLVGSEICPNIVKARIRLIFRENFPLLISIYCIELDYWLVLEIHLLSYRSTAPNIVPFFIEWLYKIVLRL
jgi:hypothetical protein